MRKEDIGLNITTVQYSFRSLVPIARHPGVILHHIGAGSTAPEPNNPGQIIHAQHLAQGWSGIGYHGVATQSGKYYTGRKYKHLGSHAVGHNDNFGLMWYGGLKDIPTPQALETLAKAIAWVALDNSFIPSTSTVKGHRDVNATECPGNLYKHIPDLIQRAKELMGLIGPVKTEPVKHPPVYGKGLYKGKEVDIVTIDGHSWFNGAQIGAVWDASLNKAKVD